MDELKKKTIKKYVFIFFIVFIFLVSIFLMIKYQVEGEKNMPFSLKQIIIKSSINYKDIKGKELWNLELSQDNDFYVYIEKNNGRDEDKIEKITIENIKINNELKIGELKVYLPTDNEVDTMYQKSTDNYMGRNLEYLAGEKDSVEGNIISKDGGMICFRVSSENIGTYKSSKAKKVTYDGNFLKEVGISEDDLFFNISFDLVIETNDGVKYRTNLNYDLPVDKFEDSNSRSKIIEDFSNIIFKRD